MYHFIRWVSPTFLLFFNSIPNKVQMGIEDDEMPTIWSEEDLLLK
jgi:hypothetical protein